MYGNQNRVCKKVQPPLVTEHSKLIDWSYALPVSTLATSLTHSHHSLLF